MFWKKAIMFGDGGKHKHTQIHAVLEGPTAEDARPTGIVVTATQTKTRDPWVQVWTFAGADYPTMREATDAWRAAGAKHEAEPSPETI